MEVLKIATAGSVDDGKSTLIGRLLYDTQSLTSDKLEAIEKASLKNGLNYLDFSLATDGLVAEREQGITIDVAHIYFSTPKRSYIIADSPGHEEYTRNMITGASTSTTSIILIDARKGVVGQTHRHFFINNLLRLKEIVVAVNKMDLVNYSEEVFNNIVTEFRELQAESSFKEQNIRFIPVSALWGENIAERSSEMDWYTGPTVLEHLEGLQPEDTTALTQARFPVQTVIRPKTSSHHDFRGYAGKISGGSLKKGDAVTILPSLTTSRIREIYFHDEKYEEAPAGSSVVITLTDELNITRGDMIVRSEELPQEKRTLEAALCWMDTKALTPGAKYLLQHNTCRVLVKIQGIGSAEDPDSRKQRQLNELGKVSIKLSRPLFVDTYESHKDNGRFILIDPQTNYTAGVGFIE